MIEYISYDSQTLEPKKPKHRFKVGEVIKQEGNYGKDYFRVTYVHEHRNGSQGLDVFGIKDGKSYGLDGDFSKISSFEEALTYICRNLENKPMERFKLYRRLRGGVWVEVHGRWLKVIQPNETWALSEMKSFTPEDNRWIK